MSLVCVQKISDQLDNAWLFHKGFGKGYKIMTHEQNPNTIKNSTIQKISKNHDKILDIKQSTMEKFSWILDLIWRCYDFCKMSISNEINIKQKRNNTWLIK